MVYVCDRCGREVKDSKLPDEWVRAVVQNGLKTPGWTVAVWCRSCWTQINTLAPPSLHPEEAPHADQ